MSEASELERALAALNGGRPDDARAACLALLATSGERPDVLRLLALSEWTRGDANAAVAAIARALARAPDDPVLLLDQARCLAGAGRGAEAVTSAIRSLERAGDRPRLCNRAGELLARLGRAPEAAAAFERALAADPSLAAARFNLGLLRVGGGDAAGAAELFREVCRERPRRPEPWLQLGGALNALGRYDEAADALERHLALTPDSVAGWTWLGAARQFQGRFEEAEEGYRRAIGLDPRAPDAPANLGRLLQAQGRPADAEAALRTALTLAPGHLQARAGLAALLDNAGRYDEALAMAATDSGDYPPETAAIAARVQRHLGRPDSARRLLEQALAVPGLPAEAEVQLRFSLGQALDECGDYPAAARSIREANRRARGRFGAAVADELAGLEAAAAALETTFSAAALKGLPRSGSSSERPLFVVGLPRAGKSLAEQVLCAHPAIHGAGELLALPDLAVELGRELGGWPEGVGRITAERLAAAAADYLAALDAADPAAARVTDTMPFNFLHLGLIELLFPAARIVHCIRHPADLALRCYAKNFAGRSLAFTTDLGDIARYFAGYRRIMAHWARVGGLAVHTLRYEDLVGRPEESIRALIDFAGLAWDPLCLRFFEDGVATSASDTPVRRPLEATEVGAWRRYRELLAEVLPELDVEAYADAGA